MKKPNGTSGTTRRRRRRRNDAGIQDEQARTASGSDLPANARAGQTTSSRGSSHKPQENTRPSTPTKPRRRRRKRRPSHGHGDPHTNAAGTTSKPADTPASHTARLANSVRPAKGGSHPAPPGQPRRRRRVGSSDTAPSHSEASGTFAALGLIDPLLRSLEQTGYTEPTPIQAQAIPGLLAGRDLLGIAQTGTGKTAAFTLPVLQQLTRSNRSAISSRPRALILTPTRELAIQIGDAIGTYGRRLQLRHTVIFGGVNQNPQVRTMKNGVHILVATPGRLLDLIGQGFIDLKRVEYFVLDEADRMLDMGFIHDMKRVLKELPNERQNLLFSATMPDNVARLAGSMMMRDHLRVQVTPAATTVERIDQSIMFVEQSDKKELLADIFADPSVARALVFSRTKHGANRLSQFLDDIGVTSAPIHGNKSQSARQRALSAFQEGRIRALVATDIAARGIDVDKVTHVINFDLPNEPESYVHRIGRTARAGCDGVAISFCMRDELDYLRDIERLTGQRVPVVADQPYHAEQILRDYRAGKRGSVKQGGRRSSGGGGRGRMGRGRRPR